MGLDDTARAIWRVRAQPLASLVANRGAVALIAGLHAGGRAAFHAARKALATWYPARQVPLGELYWAIVPGCWEALHRMPAAAAKQPVARALMHGILVQLTVLERHFEWQRTLPCDCYETGEPEFVAHVRALARLEPHVESRQVERRLRALLGRASEGGATWDGLCEAADRQGWGRLGAPLAQLTPRLRGLAEAIDLGASAEVTTIGGRAAVRVGLIDGSQRVAALDEAERAALAAVVPWIAALGGRAEGARGAREA